MTIISNVRAPQFFERYQQSTTIKEAGSVASLAPQGPATLVASTQLLSPSTMSELLAAQANDPESQARAQQFMDQLPAQSGIEAIDADAMPGFMAEKHWDMIKLQMLQKGGRLQGPALERMNQALASIDVMISKNPGDSELQKLLESLTETIEDTQSMADARNKKIADIVSKYQA
jgi:hypothetical protein